MAYRPFWNRDDGVMLLLEKTNPDGSLQRIAEVYAGCPEDGTFAEEDVAILEAVSVPQTLTQTNLRSISFEYFVDSEDEPKVCAKKIAQYFKAQDAAYAEAVKVAQQEDLESVYESLSPLHFPGSWTFAEYLAAFRTEAGAYEQTIYHPEFVLDSAETIGDTMAPFALLVGPKQFKRHFPAIYAAVMEHPGETLEEAVQRRFFGDLTKRLLMDEGLI